jgi:hypothetical protein
MIEDVFEHSLPGVVIGAVASAVLLPLVGSRNGASAAGTNGRRRANPLMKAAVRGYVTMTDRVKEMTAEAREQFQDLAAEVRDERRRQAEAADEDAESGAERAAPKRRRASRSHARGH